MNKNDYLFTSESVAEGHPDKLCDQISDAVLDAIIANSTNPQHSHAAIESLTTTQHLTLAGEYSVSGQKGPLDFDSIARGVIADVGFDDSKYNFDNNSCTIINKLHQQSKDNDDMVNTGGAGDQGLIFGSSINEMMDILPPQEGQIRGSTS